MAATMQQIADWLKKLGMSEYAQRFADNDIDFSVLPYMTDQDFEKVGVSLGHRRQMLAAIAEFVGAVTAAPRLTMTVGKLQDATERRQLELYEMTREQIEQNLDKWRPEFRNQLDFEQAFQDIKQINHNLDLLVLYEKSNVANTRIIAKHLGLIVCIIGIYVVARILEMIFQ
jgi:hypothetical protein